MSGFKADPGSKKVASTGHPASTENASALLPGPHDAGVKVNEQTAWVMPCSALDRDVTANALGLLAAFARPGEAASQVMEPRLGDEAPPKPPSPAGSDRLREADSASEPPGGEPLNAGPLGGDPRASSVPTAALDSEVTGTAAEYRGPLAPAVAPSANILAVSDVDAADTLTYSAALAQGGPLPAWLSFDPVTRSFSGTPANADVGAIELRVTATDAAGASASDVFRITIANTNDAPVLAAALADQAATEDAPFVHQIPAGAFSDVDAADTLTYTATLAQGGPLPAWLSFDPVTRSFSGTPANADVGAIELRVTATDAAGASASDVFRITIANTNDAPVLAAALADQAATEDAPFAYLIPAGAFADVDAADTLTYTATLAQGGPLPAWLAFNPATRTFSGTPGHADIGAVEIRITVTDTAGSTASDVFQLTTNRINLAPADLVLTGATTVFGLTATYNATYDKFYSLIASPQQWEAAMDLAQQSFLTGVAGTLVRIESSAENNWLSSVFTSGAQFHIGASDKAEEGVWRLYDGDVPGSIFWIGDWRGTQVDGRFNAWEQWDPNNANNEDYALGNANGTAWFDSSGAAAQAVVEWRGADVRAAAAVQNGGAAMTVMENAAAGTLVGTLMRHFFGEVAFATFSPDSRRVVTASSDQTARVWDVATGMPIGPPMRHEGGVTSAAFSPDGRRVLTVSSDSSARLWDASWPSGNIIEIACAFLADRGLGDLQQRFGFALDRPICQPPPPFDPARIVER